LARRRYKGDAYSSAAHTQKPEEAAPSGQLPLSGSEPSSPQPPAPDTQGEVKPDASGLKAQIDHMRAQREQAQQPQPQQQAPLVDGLAMYLAGLGLSPSKFIFLYQHFAQRPHLLNNDYWQLLKMAHEITTKDRNIPEDSNEYFAHMHALLNQQAAASPSAAPPPMPPPTAQPQTHIDIEKTESPEGEPEEVHMRAEHVVTPSSRNSHRAKCD
jgi:hypothetical protein